MPAGLQQMVGEMGWQLSHGERSRLFIARALLQGARMIVLDESFAALDPENLERALRYVLKRASPSWLSPILNPELRPQMEISEGGPSNRGKIGRWESMKCKV